MAVGSRSKKYHIIYWNSSFQFPYQILSKLFQRFRFEDVTKNNLTCGYDADYRMLQHVVITAKWVPTSQHSSKNVSKHSGVKRLARTLSREKGSQT